MEKSIKTGEFTLLADILHPFLDKTLSKSDKWFAFKLWQHWSKLGTADIIKQSRPVHFQKGKLVLWVDNSVQLMELSFQIEELKNNINTHFKKKWVTDIHFTVNKEVLQKRKKSAYILSKIFAEVNQTGYEKGATLEVFPPQR